MAILRAQRAKDYGVAGSRVEKFLCCKFGLQSCRNLAGIPRQKLKGEMDSPSISWGPTALSSHTEGASSGWTKGKTKTQSWDAVMIPV